MESVYNDLVRPPRHVVAAFTEILSEYSPSCLVTDARRRVGAIGSFQTVRHEHKVAGPALTVNLAVDDLVDHMLALRHAAPGDIIVVASHGTRFTAMWGGLMSALSLREGLAGGIIDGAVRDVDEIRDLNFPLWYRSVVPRPSATALHGRLEPVQVNVPVVVEDQVINPGDLLVADENGIAVVPPDSAQEVLERVRASLSKERAIREKIEAGITVSDLVKEFGFW